MSNSLDTAKLEREVKSMYRDVATTADAEFHFETGRELAERLGYDTDDLRYVPDAAIDSFAGVGYYFDLAGLEPGQSVLDLGSGSGMDAFVAGVHVTETGTVTGIDMTDEQVEKAELSQTTTASTTSPSVRGTSRTSPSRTTRSTR